MIRNETEREEIEIEIRALAAEAAARLEHATTSGSLAAMPPRQASGTGA